MNDERSPTLMVCCQTTRPPAVVHPGVAAFITETTESLEEMTTIDFAPLPSTSPMTGEV